MTSENLYPEIISENKLNIMIDDKISDGLNIERLKHMIRESTILEEQFIKYKKIQKPWNKTNNVVKLSGSILALLTGSGVIIISVLTAGTTPLLIVTSSSIISSILSSTSLLSGFLTAVVSMRFTKRKKKQFNKRIKLTKEYQNKLFYYTQKVREDKNITLEELEKFDLLLNEYNNKLLELKNQQNKDDKNMNGSFTLLKNKNKKKVEKKINEDLKVKALEKYYKEKTDELIKKKLPEL